MKNQLVKRRNFIKHASITAAATVVAAPASTYASESHKLKLTTTWPPRTPILQQAPEMFAKLMKVATNGRVNIKVYAGGELIPPLGVLDAVSQGSIDIGVSAPYYWAGKCPAAQFFSSVPFGMNTQQFKTWLSVAGGQELWEEAYAPFNVVPLSFGNTGTQMGGWYKKQISSMSDLKGLKIRMPGLGGKVLAEAGANVVLMAGAEIYTALERGTIDATEWISPFHDERLGLHRAAKHYYYPGWHEPSSNLELIINKRIFEGLPTDIQEIIRAVTHKVGYWCFYKSELENAPALERLKSKHKVIVEKFPDEVLQGLRAISSDVVDAVAKSDPMAQKVYSSYQAFRKQIAPWSEISEEAYAAALRG